MSEIRRSEKTLLFAHYDYFTGRALRILLNLEDTTANIDAACACLVVARKERSSYQSKQAKKLASECYHVWRLQLTDVQLRVLDTCASAPPNRLQQRLLETLELELVKRNQLQLQTT